MKVYVSWDEWYPFPFLSKETPDWADEVDIPDELYERHQRIVKELEQVIDEIASHEL